MKKLELKMENPLNQNFPCFHQRKNLFEAYSFC